MGWLIDVAIRKLSWNKELVHMIPLSLWKYAIRNVINYHNYWKGCKKNLLLLPNISKDKKEMFTGLQYINYVLDILKLLSPSQLSFDKL